MTLGELAVQLTAETREFNSKMSEAAEAVEHLAKRFKRASREVAMVGAELAAIGAESIRAAAKANPATQRAFEDLKVSFERIGAEVGQSLLPVMREITKVVREVGDWFRSLDPALKQNLARYAAIAAGVLLAIGVFGELAGVVAGLSGLFTIASAAIGLLMGPVGLVVLAIASLVVWVILLRHAWETNLGGLRDYVLGMKDAVVDAWDAIKTGVNEGLTAFVNANVALFNLVIQGISGMLTFVLNAFDKVLTVAGTAGKMVGLNLDLTSAHGALSTASAAVSPDALKGYIGAGGSAVGGAAASVAAGIGSQKDKAVQAGKSIVEWIKDAFIEAGGDITKFGKDLIARLGLSGGTAQGLSRERLTVSSGKGAGANDKLFDVTESQGFQQFWSDLRVRAALSGTQAPTTLGAASQFAAERSTKVSFTPAAQQQGRAMDFATMAPFQKFSTWLSDQWLTDAMATLQNGATSLGDKIGTAFASVGQMLTNSLIQSGGLFGETVNAAMKGFTSGGIWGALAAVLATLLEHSKVFQYIVNILNTVLQRVADVLGSLLSGIEPMLGAVDNVDRAVNQSLAPIFKALGSSLGVFAPLLQLVAMLFQVLAPVFKLFGNAVTVINDVLTRVGVWLYEVIQAVGVKLLQFLIWISQVWNTIVQAIQGVFSQLASIDINIAGHDFGNPFGFMQAWADALNGAMITTSGLNDTMNTLKNTTYTAAQAAANNTAAQDANSAALNKATESLTNVPEGFKVAMERFNATQAGAGPNIKGNGTYGTGYDNQGNPNFGQQSAALGSWSGPGGPGGGSWGNPGSGSNVASPSGGVVYVTIQSNDANAMWQQIKRLAERDHYRTRNSFSRG